MMIDIPLLCKSKVNVNINAKTIYKKRKIVYAINS